MSSPGRENPAPPRVIVLLETFPALNAEQDSDNKNKKQETKRKIKKENNKHTKPITHPSDLRSRVLTGGGNKSKTTRE